MLHCRASLLSHVPATLKLTRLSVDDKNAAVCMRGSSDHIGNEVTVAWCIEDTEAPVLSREVPRCHLNRDATLFLLLGLVHKVGEPEPNLIVYLCQPFHLLQLVVGEDAVLQEYLAG